MKYSEIFHTLQGEGRLVGVPSIFFRTSYCNLRCWWCDSAYTSWHPENKDITVQQAYKAIWQLAMENSNCRHVVITGGEPYIQGDELAQLCTLLSSNEFHVTIETNATVYVETQAHLISMSPKLANSTPVAADKESGKWEKRHERERIKYGVIKRFLDTHSCQVKFVVCDASDMDEILELEIKVPIDRGRICLMPEGKTSEQVSNKSVWLAEICRSEGYRFSPRLHVDLWGDRRGV